MQDFDPKDFARIIGMLIGALMALYIFGKFLLNAYFRLKEKNDKKRDEDIDKNLARLEEMIKDAERKFASGAVALRASIDEIQKFREQYVGEIKVLQEQMRVIGIQNGTHYKEVLQALRDFVKRTDDRFKTIENRVDQHGQVLAFHDGILEPYKRKTKR